jgi:uncharacterized membrane protein YbjE (DUF340 family)
MTLILALLTACFMIGQLLRDRTALAGVISRLTDVAIYLLLFLLGISVAATPDLADSLISLGVPALVLSLAGVLGSCLLARFMQRWIRLEVNTD